MFQEVDEASEDTQKFPYHGNERRHPGDKMNKGSQNLMDQPFWRVMSFLFAGLFAVCAWLMKSNLEKLEKVSDSQIETKAIVKYMAEQSKKDQDTINMIRMDVDQLKLSDRTQQEQINSLGRAR